MPSSTDDLAIDATTFGESETWTAVVPFGSEPLCGHSTEPEYVPPTGPVPLPRHLVRGRAGGGHRRAPGCRPVHRRGSRRSATSRDGPDDPDDEPGLEPVSQ